MTEGGGKCEANIEKAQKKQKLHYDGKHGAGDLYTDGSEVLKKDFRRKKRQGSKLDYLQLGRFMITATLGNGLYCLKEVNGNNLHCLQTVHNECGMSFALQVVE